jgi:hypothetical protein
VLVATEEWHVDQTNSLQQRYQFARLGKPSRQSEPITRRLFSARRAVATDPGYLSGKPTASKAEKWSKPEKLPEQINAGGRVIAPFLHPDGQTLYRFRQFAGMGASDLFFVRKQPDGSWGNPVNLAYPINTKGSEEMLVVSLDGKQAYFASNRSSGAGGLDIYSFEMPEAARPQPVTYARARITDAVTGNPLVAKADFIDLKTGSSFVSSNSKSDGTVPVCLPAGKSYALNVSKEGYLFYSENFDLLESATAAKPFQLDIALIPFDADTVTGEVKTLKKPIALRNVFFETGDLRPEAGIGSRARQTGRTAR